jgi:16S rRNA (cytosine967-C5)-methyltransferase
MSGNYRPRRRYGRPAGANGAAGPGTPGNTGNRDNPGTPGNRRNPGNAGAPGKANEGGAGTRAAAPGAAPRAGRGEPTGKPGAPRARNGAGAPPPGKRDGAARAKPARSADPRRVAYDVLAAVREREAYANLLLPRLLADRGLTGRDAAFATELTYGTLRGQGSYDAVLTACSDRPLDKLDPPVLDVLRLGAHQLLSTRVGAHAAVATSVDLAKSVIGPRVSGYVNAVLRRVATRDLPAWLDIVAPSQATDPDGYLATRYSHPRWIVAAYRDALGDAAGRPAPATVAPAAPEGTTAPGARGAETSPAPAAPQDGVAPEGTIAPGARGAETSPAGAGTPAAREDDPAAREAEAAGGAALTELEAALAAGNARPRVTLATFPSGPPREDVMPAGAEPGRWSPYAFTLQSGDPAPLIEAGTAAVQDEGSQLAALALSRARLTSRASQGDDATERWLDLCAGPGGKARLLYGLAAMKNAHLTAAELHPHRAAMVRDVLNTASRIVTAPPPASGAPAPAAPAAPAAPVSEVPASGTPASGTPTSEGPAFEVIVADGTSPAWADGAFDRALVDVPCSGLGALRRRPEARWRKSANDLKELTALQRDLLRSALKAVRPGGVVAYVTCSPLPAETSDVVAEVAASMPGVELLDTPEVLADVPDVAASDPRFAQLWPHRHGTDAIFIAILRRGE